MRDEPQEILAVDRGITEAFVPAVAVRVQATTADAHHLAITALRGQGFGADLPGHRGGVVKRVVEAVRRYVQARVGGPRVGRAERVELLDGTIGVDDDDRARQQAQAVYGAVLAQDELDELAEHADPGFLPRRRIPAFEDADQPVRITGTPRRAVPVSVRQQQVERRGTELQQCLVRADRIVVDVDRAQDAAVAVSELRRPQQVQSIRDGTKAVAAAGVAAVPPGSFGIAIEADTDPGAGLLEHVQHGPVQQRAVGLDGHVHARRYLSAERGDQAGQPVSPGEKRFTAMQDDLDAREVMARGMLRDPLHSATDHRRAHPPWQIPPSLIRHFIHVAV